MTSQPRWVSADPAIPRGTAAEAVSGPPTTQLPGPGLDHRAETVDTALYLPAYAVVAVGFAVPAG